MKFLPGFLAAVVFFLSPAAMAASVGFYAGIFDPPTQSEIRMMRCVLGDADLHRNCAEIGKQISRLVVLLREDGKKDALASTRERVLMLRAALQKHRDRVEIVPATTAQAEEKKRALVADKNIDQLFLIVPAASHNESRVSPDSQASKTVWLTFPLEEGADSKAPAVDRSGGLAAKEVIDKLGLYQDVSPDLAGLQRSLFEESWKGFLEDLNSACPISLNRTDCSKLSSRWETIPIVTPDDSTKKTQNHNESSVKTQLIYNPFQSEDRWAEKFVKTALQFVDGSEAYHRLKPVADDLSARVFQGYPQGKLSRLRRVLVKKNTASIGPLRVSRKPVACSAPQGTYNADMDQYLADRFPRAFSAFLKERIARPSSSPVELFVHNHPLEDAYESHRRDGYATFYFLQTRRGQGHRNIYLAVGSKPGSYRVVLTSVRGKDRQANVLCQIQRTGVFSSYRFVEARQEQPLFVFNPRGKSLRLSETDWLLFGFKGNWTRKLRAEHWQQQPLVEEGLDIDLFTHPTIKHKIVVARNVYGDDGLIILNAFYQKGGRRVLYLGSAGAIADYQIGDVVIPNEFTDLKHNIVRFDKNFARAYRSEIGNLVNVHVEKKHGWVQSLFDETTDVLLDWRARSVVSVDIEGLHLARFSQAHRDLEMAALFVISDQTLGDMTIEDTNALRGLIDESVDKLMSFFLPKVVNPKVSHVTQ
jgi:uridine phosphorylase